MKRIGVGAKAQRIICFTADVPVEQVKDKLIHEIKVRYQLYDIDFIMDESSESKYGYVVKDIPLGSAVHRGQKSSEYSVYDTYTNLGMPSGKQNKALALIKIMNELL